MGGSQGSSRTLFPSHYPQSNVTEEDKAPSRRLSDKGFRAAFIEITNLVQQFIMELGARETSSDSWRVSLPESRSQSVSPWRRKQWFFIIIFAYLIIIRLGGHLLQNTSQTWHIFWCILVNPGQSSKPNYTDWGYWCAMDLFLDWVLI